MPGRPSPVQRNPEFTDDTSEDEFSVSREGIESQVPSSAEDRELLSLPETNSRYGCSKFSIFLD